MLPLTLKRLNSRRLFYAEIVFLIALVLGCGPEGVPRKTQRDLQIAARICYGIFICVTVVATHIPFLMQVRRTLGWVRPENRAISPGTVWIALVPLAGGIWALRMVERVAQSLRREFEDRRWPTANEGFGRLSGSVWAGGLVYAYVAAVLEAVLLWRRELGAVQFLLFAVIPAGIAIAFVVYWVQVYVYGTRLRGERSGHRAGSIRGCDD
jgi:hypothetical protein